MTAQPTRDQLRALALREDAKEHQPDSHGPDRCGDPECFASCVVDGCDWPCATAWLLDQLAQAEADRDWNLRSSRIAKRGRIEANARAERAEARIKAVQDVLDRAHDEFEQPSEAGIRRALESGPPPGQ